MPRHPPRKSQPPAAAPPDLCFEQLAGDYLAWSRLQHTPSTYRTRCDLVRNKLVPYFRGWPIADIRPRDVEHLIASYPRLSPASRNRIVSALSAVFRYGRRLGHLRRNATARVPRAREEVTALPLVSLADQDALLAHLKPELQLLFLTALDTGVRLGELLRLRWSDLDADQSGLLVRRSKSKRPRLVRLSARLAARLQCGSATRTAGSDPDALLFADAVATSGELRWTWRQAFKRAARAIGHPRLRIHDLRHLAAINLVRAGVDLPTVQAHLGHRHLLSTLRYASYADESASGRAAKALDRLHASTPPPGTPPPGTPPPGTPKEP